MAEKPLDPRYATFLEALREGKTVDASRRESNLNWKMIYETRKKDGEFRQAWDGAIKEGSYKFFKVKAFTEEREAQFLDLISQGETIKNAAQKVEANPSSFYRRRQNNPEFAERWDAATSLGDKFHARKMRDNEAQIFLDNVKAGTGAETASNLAGRDLSTFYRLRKEDPSFDRDWAEAALLGAKEKKRKKAGLPPLILPAEEESSLPNALHVIRAEDPGRPAEDLAVAASEEIQEESQGETSEETLEEAQSETPEESQEETQGEAQDVTQGEILEKISVES
jgi:hypothetical protein